jgi:hypothetical protein
MPAPQTTCNACNCKSLPGQRGGWRQLAVDQFGQFVLSRYSRELRRIPGSSALLHSAWACGRTCTNTLFQRFMERGNFTAPPRMRRTFAPSPKVSTFAPQAQQRSFSPTVAGRHFSPSVHPQSKPAVRDQVAA